jgi:hypothetical protein
LVERVVKALAAILKRSTASDEVNSKWLTVRAFTWRLYQHGRLVDAVEAYFGGHERLLIVAPWGVGREPRRSRILLSLRAELGFGVAPA